MSVDDEHDQIFSAPDDLYDGGTTLLDESAETFVELWDRLDEVEEGLIAATFRGKVAKFNPNLHPRGRDGKFIEKFGSVFAVVGGKKRRGTVKDIKEGKGGPDIVVEFDDGKTETLKPNDIEQAPEAKARLTALPPTQVEGEEGRVRTLRGPAPEVTDEKAAEASRLRENATKLDDSQEDDDREDARSLRSYADTLEAGNNLTSAEKKDVERIDAKIDSMAKTEAPEPRELTDKDMAERDARKKRLRARVHREDEHAEAPEFAPGEVPDAEIKGRQARDQERGLFPEETPVSEEDLEPDVANLEVNEPIAGHITGGSGTQDDPYRTTNVDAAVQLLAKDKYVQLNQPDEVATLLDELKAIADDAKKKGESAPDYDLCKVSVPNTNLFCHDHKGIPRIQMPQLSGKPTPGSKADLLPKDKKGEVDIGPLFVEHLQSKGIPVNIKSVQADHLRASQNQLVGTKVAGMAAAIEAGVMPPGSIFTTRDNYVVDGHHRWAATVGAEYKTGQPMDMEVKEIDLDILAALSEAFAFATEMGIPPKAGAGPMTEGVGPAAAAPLA